METCVYMCFPCRQEFSSLEEVLSHQLTCTLEGVENEASLPGVYTEHNLTELQLDPNCFQAPVHTGTSSSLESVPQGGHVPSNTSQDVLIRYQCRDCELLFDSLHLWQEHHKQGECRVVQAGAGAPEQEATQHVEDSVAGHAEKHQEGVEAAEMIEQTEEVWVESEMTVNTEDSLRESREREKAISQDHSYLQVAEVCEVKEPEEQIGAQVQPADTGGGFPQVGPHTNPVGALTGLSSPEVASPSIRKRSSKKAKAAMSKHHSLLCVDCGSGFSFVSELVAHRRAKHSLEGALHHCRVCGESFLNTTLFLYHRKKHVKKPQEVPTEVAREEEVPQIEEEQGPKDVGLSGAGYLVVENGVKKCGPGTSEGEAIQVEKLAATTPVKDLTEDPVTAVISGSEHVPPSFLCVTCGSGFNSEPELAAHRKSQHGLEEALHHCPQCGQVFMNTTLFLYHRRQHKHKDKDGGAQKRQGDGARLEGPQAPKRVVPVLPVAASETTQAALTNASGPDTEGGKGERTVREVQNTGFDPVSDGLPSEDLYRDWSRTPLLHVCPHCGQKFTQRCQLWSHVFSHTGEKLFRCRVCSKDFHFPSALIRHSRTHGGTKPYNCKHCGKAFTQLGSLKRHHFIHAKADPSGFRTQNNNSDLHASGMFVCGVCNQFFKRKKLLDVHSFIHQEKDTKSCPHCSMKFYNQTVLDAHLQHCTGEDDRSRGRGRGQGRGRCVGQLECDMCGHCCVTQEGLDLHKLSHMGQTPLHCPLIPCRRRFATKAALEKHVLAHCQNLVKKSGKPASRPFSCVYCGKGFAYASTFRLHMRTHTGERPFACSQCGKRFRQLPHLQDHERTHSGEKPFSCWVCGKSFSVVARLTEHARTHSSEKAHTCSMCPRAFRSRANLEKHLRIHGVSAEAPAREGEAAVQTILLVQTSAPALIQASPQTESDIGETEASSAVVFLHPPVSVVDGEDIQHSIELIIGENM